MGDSIRAERLKKYFNATTKSGRKISSKRDADQFLEALLAIEKPTTALEKLVSGSYGIPCLQTCILTDLSPDGIAKSLQVVGFFSCPEVHALDRTLLESVITAMVTPETFWNSAMVAFTSGKLLPESTYPFACLVQEMLALPNLESIDILSAAKRVIDMPSLRLATDPKITEVVQKIKNMIQLNNPASAVGMMSTSSAGGRHDNDFANIKDISIYPTHKELMFEGLPFYRTRDDVFDTNPDSRAAVHRDNQFRLLREDMLGEMRESLQSILGKGKENRKRPPMKLSGLSLESLTWGKDNRYKGTSMMIQCRYGLEKITSLKPNKRKTFLDDHKNYLKYGSCGVLMHGDVIICFVLIERDEMALQLEPPLVCIGFPDSKSFSRALEAMRLYRPEALRLVLVDTAVFAYEPILNRLKTMSILPIQDILLNTVTTRDNGHLFSDDVSIDVEDMDSSLRTFVSRLSSIDPRTESIKLVADDAIVALDVSQRDALITGLLKKVSVIQGPPGTGKSFTGAQIVKGMVKRELKVLVITFTNHALDQFITDVMKAGVGQDCIVRLGSKASSSLETMSLYSLGTGNIPYEIRNVISQIKCSRDSTVKEIEEWCKKVITDNTMITLTNILEYLEFYESETPFFDAFDVASHRRMNVTGADSGFEPAQSSKRNHRSDYLIDRWERGLSAGDFEKYVSEEMKAVWDIPQGDRTMLFREWTNDVLREQNEPIEIHDSKFRQYQQQLDTLFSQKYDQPLSKIKIVACTTNGAARYSDLISRTCPDAIVVEEAGEILESHVLTALSPTVKQLVLIGDHKQLRPKVNNYGLTVERGDGFDLNMSMFERLVVQGYRHITLQKQHRMHPEISKFPRAMTYPDLEDDPKTYDRKEITGLQNRVIYINHSRPEVDGSNGLCDRSDSETTASKENLFEAQFVLRIVIYLSQQGYSSSDIVILTPYLGQLKLIQKTMCSSFAAIVNELDARDLAKQGFDLEKVNNSGKTSLRISTIDNYQGEESKIVVASMTRSNNRGDIGFMKSPERLNVLITRARDCLIMVGNKDTFLASKSGRSTWIPFFTILREHNHLYDGLPIICHRHPERKGIVKDPVEFNQLSPDGGCREPCTELMACGEHKCPQKCHRITTFSHKECYVEISQTCDRNHSAKVKCFKRNSTCGQCTREDRERERIAKLNIQLEIDAKQKREAYRRELEMAHEKIALLKREEQLREEERQMSTDLETQKKQIEALQKKATEDRRKDKQEAAQKKRKSVPVAPLRVSSAGGQAKHDWNLLQQQQGATSDEIDALMDMVGLESVKQSFLEIKSKVDTAILQEISLSNERFSCTMLGNPGTGKTTVARLYAKFLSKMGVIPGLHFEETTGSKLAANGVKACEAMIARVLSKGGGVIFVDEAYQLTSGNNMGGGAVLDLLLAEIENQVGKIVFVVAGYNREMETFFSHNPGLTSRFPIEMKFADYTDSELLDILRLKIHAKFNGKMKCEEGDGGIYCRTVARRVGYRRGTEGFGNARAMENALAKVHNRQASRIRFEKSLGKNSGGTPDVFLFTKEDLIGPEPQSALVSCDAWRELQGMVGLASVKQSISNLVDLIKENYQRELNEKPLIQYSLNKVFLGSPGTGKTTIAKLYGKILCALGLLTKSEVITKVPADFVGSAMGGSEAATKGILSATQGKVLVIDEAYGLYTGLNGQNDPYRAAVIDTIVGEVHSVPGDDRCVLLLGYQDKMEEMYQNVNPGLARRFPIASAFLFEDFTKEELGTILDLKVKKASFTLSGEARSVALEVLERARSRPNFGNAGEIDILLDRAKQSNQQRINKKEKKRGCDVLDEKDFDPEFDRSQRTTTDVANLFKDSVGAENVVEKLKTYQETVRTMKEIGIDAIGSIPFNFIFRGPPGTGKTTTARKMGQVFYDMGFLATAEVMEVSASQIIGSYVGQTGPLVRSQMDKALGRVLFIDEAYRLGEGHFAKEAIDELVDCVTKERYQKKMIIILAGYEKDMNSLMAVNEGLSSRFPEVIDFRAFTPHECWLLLGQHAHSKAAELAKKNVHLRISTLKSHGGPVYDEACRLFETMVQQASWANARDIITLSEKIFQRVLKDKEGVSKKKLRVDRDMVLDVLRGFVTEREERATNTKGQSLVDDLMQMKLGDLREAPQTQVPQTQVPQTQVPQMATATIQRRQQMQVQAKAQEEEDEDEYEFADAMTPPQMVEHELDSFFTPPKTPAAAATSSRRRRLATARDSGVSDAVWAQLQQNIQAEMDEEERQEAEAQELKRKADVQRLADDSAAVDRIIERLQRQEKERKEKAAMLEKLRKAGRCPAGYEWVKQQGGFRCTGGSHWMSNMEAANILQG